MKGGKSHRSHIHCGGNISTNPTFTQDSRTVHWSEAKDSESRLRDRIRFKIKIQKFSPRDIKGIRIIIIIIRSLPFTHEYLSRRDVFTTKQKSVEHADGDGAACRGRKYKFSWSCSFVYNTSTHRPLSSKALLTSQTVSSTCVWGTAFSSRDICILLFKSVLHLKCIGNIHNTLTSSGWLPWRVSCCVLKRPHSSNLQRFVSESPVGWDQYCIQRLQLVHNAWTLNSEGFKMNR